MPTEATLAAARSGDNIGVETAEVTAFSFKDPETGDLTINDAAARVVDENPAEALNFASLCGSFFQLSDGSWITDVQARERGYDVEKLLKELPRV